MENLKAFQLKEEIVLLRMRDAPYLRHSRVLLVAADGLGVLTPC
jgi:hypothetical protein